MTSYTPKILPRFDVFILQRRIDTIVEFANADNLDRAKIMLNEISDNIRCVADSDLGSIQKEFVAGYVDMILKDLNYGMAPRDVLLNYLVELKKYLLEWEIAIENAKKSLVNNDYHNMPPEIRELIACALV